MSDSRVKDKESNPLKEISGRLQKLSYTDMKLLAGLIGSRLGQDQGHVAECLLQVAHNILEEK